MFYTKFVLILSLLKCITSSEIEIVPQFEVYDEHNFGISLPKAKYVKSFSIGATRKDNDEIHEEPEYAVDANVIDVSGNKFDIVEGSVINYTITYQDEGGKHRVSGQYIFDGEYQNRQQRFIPNDEQDFSENDVSIGISRGNSHDENPVLESRFGDFGRGRHHGRRHHPRPPLGIPPGRGIPPYPYHRGPGRFPPPPFPGPFAHGHHHHHHHCHFDSSEFDNPDEPVEASSVRPGPPADRWPPATHAPKPVPSVSTEKITTTTTTEFPQIDIRFSDD